MARLNPVFSGIRVEEGIETAASVKGVAGKTLLLLAIAVASAITSITVGAPMIAENPSILFIVAIGALIGSIVPGPGTLVGAAVALIIGLIYYGVTEVLAYKGKSLKDWAKQGLKNGLEIFSNWITNTLDNSEEKKMCLAAE